MSVKVNSDDAQKWVDAWLEHKRIRRRKRKEYQLQIDTLVEAVEEGDIQINEETLEMTQHLAVGIGESEQIKQLKYLPRVSVEVLNSKTKGLKATDSEGRILAFVAAITQQPTGIIKNMDSTDYSIAQSIVVFFI